MKILIGADPELFMHKDGAYVSAYAMIPGTKDQPHVVPLGAVQVDGMALEFNIDPVDTEDAFVYSIQSVMNTLVSMVPGYAVHPTPVAHFTAEYLQQQPEVAKELGCSPDMNAWTGMTNPLPDATRLFRTGAGHLHIGWTQGEQTSSLAHLSACTSLVKELDFYQGLPSLMFDNNAERRQLYGRAGACRVKPYGVEYRVLSNAWLASEERVRWAYTSAMQAVESLMSGQSLVQKYGDIQHIINESKVDEAAKIMDAEGIRYVV